MQTKAIEMQELMLQQQGVHGGVAGVLITIWRGWQVGGTLCTSSPICSPVLLAVCAVLRRVCGQRTSRFHASLRHGCVERGCVQSG